MKRVKIIIPVLLTVLAISCGAKKQNVPEVLPENLMDMSSQTTFNSDSAFRFIKEQVDFGPRIPGTSSHSECSVWLEEKLKGYTGNVYVQQGKVQAFNGDILPIRNIFSSINPEHPDRVLLIAHYDTRPWADGEDETEKQRQPIDGANDGGSGTAVLLELARVLSQNNFRGGVDFLLVDAEDYGSSNSDLSNEKELDSWCLGTQYWIDNPPQNFNLPRFAILVDMVGGKNAKFHREYFSQMYATEVVDYIWRIASTLGFGDIFIDKTGNPITDDHFYFLKAGIPAIDIIENQHPQTGSFNPTWHTLNDNIENISGNTLNAVGLTLQEALQNFYQ